MLVGPRGFEGEVTASANRFFGCLEVRPTEMSSLLTAYLAKRGDDEAVVLPLCAKLTKLELAIPGGRQRGMFMK